MANVALIGASGNVGSRILKELSDRGHSVTGIARHAERIASLPDVTAASVDVSNPKELAAVLRGHDAVISAVRFVDSKPAELATALREAGVHRWLVVGGAGSLEVAPGKRLVDQPDFPAAYKQEALAGADFLAWLQREADDLDWTFLSPSALFVPGDRTGHFRRGNDTLLTGEQGSKISFEDYAVALVDELEEPRHVHARFTVGY